MPTHSRPGLPWNICRCCSRGVRRRDFQRTSPQYQAQDAERGAEKISAPLSASGLCRLIFQGRGVADFFAVLLGLEDAAHDFAAAGLGEFVPEFDALDHGHGTEFPADMILEG